MKDMIPGCCSLDFISSKYQSNNTDKRKYMKNREMPPFSPFSNLCPLTNNTSRNSSRDMIENSSEDTSTLGTSTLLDTINNSTQDSKENPPPHNQHIDWSSQHYTNSCKKKLEHSFSDVSQFDINVTANPIKPKPLRADFLHLAGVALHSRRSKNSVSDYLHNHIGEKDGFAFRSIQRSISCISENCRDDSAKTIVVVPSLDLDSKELKRMCDCIECYEDRQLFYLLMAKDPSVRIIYLTSNDVNESVVHYYLSLCQDEDCDMHDMLSRVFTISVPSKKKYIPLSEKILQDKNLVDFIKCLIQRKNSLSNDSAGLCVFTGSDSVEKLSYELGIRLLEASTDHLYYGTKQGSRDVFAKCGIPHPSGTPSIHDDDLLTYGEGQGEDNNHFAHKHRCIRSSHALAIGIARQIINHNVCPRKWMVKLNQGFSGKGNASIDLTRFQDCSNYSSAHNNTEEDVLCLASNIEKEFASGLRYEDPKMTWFGDEEHNGFQTQIARLGVIAEAFIEGEVPSSPSIQAIIEPASLGGGRVSIVSTHEQLLDGQVYNGCINPASEQYRSEIMEMGLKVGQYMADRGVVGHFSCDFLATQKPNGGHNLYAVEINLRTGGTTHPEATLALLVGGCISSDGIFNTNDNEVRTYIATDCHSIKPCSESDLIRAIECKTNPLACKIRWNKTERVGVVFHLFKFASRGRIGFTAIGRDKEESQQLFDTTKEFLLQMR